MPSRSAAFKTDHLNPSLGGVVFGDAETFAHFAHTHRCSSFAIARLAAHSVERYRKFSIRPVSGKLAERINCGGRHVGRIPASLDARALVASSSSHTIS